MSLPVCGCHGDEVGPRPPVPGEEDQQVFQVEEGGHTPSQWAEGSEATPHRSDLGPGFEPFETLLALLDDRDATGLFQHFLRGLGRSALLDCWFACSGFRKVPAAAAERRLKLAGVMYRCYLCERRGAVTRYVSERTRRGVLDAIRRRQLDSGLFAQAQAEVQAVLESSCFPLFLRSDEYLKHTQSGEQMLKKLPPSADHRKTASLGCVTTPPHEKGAESESERLPPHNAANQKSPDKKKRSQRRHSCHQHRATLEREKTHTHRPHTPMEMRTHTFTAELMRRLQALQTQTRREEAEADVTNAMADSPAHSLCYCGTEPDIKRVENTCEVTHSDDERSPAHTHSTDCAQKDTGHCGSAADSITVVYYLCGELIPYRTCVQGNSVTLAQFKSLLTRRGSYRFYFKRASDEFDCGVVYEEIREDETVLPTYDLKIIAKVERMNE